MATRSNTFLIRRSNVAGNVPSAGQILLGELALNTADVKLYASGTTANSILPIGWDRVARTGDTLTGNFYINGYMSATTINANIIQSGGTNLITIISSLLSGYTNGNIYSGISTTQVLETLDGTTTEGCQWLYTVVNGGNIRTGNILVGWNTSSGTTTVTDYSTSDLGSTTGITFDAALVGNNLNLSAVVTSQIWKITLKRITAYGNTVVSGGSGGVVSTAVTTSSISVNINGNGNIILTGQTGGYQQIPYNATINGWTIFEGSNTPLTSNTVVDVWKKSSFYPTSADTIFAVNKPGMTGTTINTATGLSIVITAGDWLGYNVVSSNAAKNITLNLNITKG